MYCTFGCLCFHIQNNKSGGKHYIELCHTFFPMKKEVLYLRQFLSSPHRLSPIPHNCWFMLSPAILWNEMSDLTFFKYFCSRIRVVRCGVGSAPCVCNAPLKPSNNSISVTAKDYRFDRVRFDYLQNNQIIVGVLNTYRLLYSHG